MIASAGLLAVLLVVLLLQLRSALGWWRGLGLVGGGVLLLGGAWGALEWEHRRRPPPPEDQTDARPITSEQCRKCHEGHYQSWHRTYHRSMTREATPANVKADFNDAEHHYLGVTSYLRRTGDRFYLDTIDPRTESAALSQGSSTLRREFTVDRLVGSHWFQQLMTRDADGRYLRLPLAYHLGERRWLHIDGVFLSPDTGRYFSKANVWNETCLYCHNTRPVQNPLSGPEGNAGYDTEVGELGIACEACHGAAERHVRAHRNPASRLAQHYSARADPTIVNPARLPVARADEVCGRCHGGVMPRLEHWNPLTLADPFLAGRELRRFWHVTFSEAEMRQISARQGTKLAVEPRPDHLDGRFWGDGTPLTTALEYLGVKLSACYQDGQGKLSCLTCHSMHHGDPDHQVKDGLRHTNTVCYGCHEKYRERLVEHTHHPANSPGSLCYNCHMPHQVFSLMTTHRSHRIDVPRVKDSLGTGKPHACNLCHLDKSLGWTQEQLGKWYGTRPVPLSDDDKHLASSVLHLLQSDARSRGVVAGAFSWPPAQQASGRDWPGLLLTRFLEHERYQVVRYTAYKALRSLHGFAPGDYNFQGAPAERANQVRALRRALESQTRPEPSRYPYLPLTRTGRFADDALDRLLKSRNDPDVSVNE